MSSISELLREYASLPLGDIYVKKINHKKYYYHQYFQNGKRYTTIVKKEELEELQQKIARRKTIEAQLKAIYSSTKNVTLSKKAKELTGQVMSDNKVVATFLNGNLTSIDEKLAPLVIKRTHSIEKFLELRCIDISRTNARLLRKTLNIKIDEDYQISLYAYALSISDNYWFKPAHSKIKYNDIIFNNDIYSDIALKGDLSYYPNKASLSPELTTTGSFEKGWKYINNIWWLYKVGTDKQYFSELFSSKFASLIGIDTVSYEYVDGFIRCQNFSNKYNFEPMVSIAGEDDSYDHVFNILYKLKKEISRDYLKLIFFDSIVYNVDRHNENTGLLRDRTSGKIISLAPNFDNNLSLLSNVNKLNHYSKDGFIKIFMNFLSNNQVALSLFETIDFPKIDITDIKKIISTIPIQVDYDDLAKDVLDRYNGVLSKFNKQHN